MVKIDIKGQSKTIPSELNECTPAQIKMFVNLVYMQIDKLFITDEKGNREIKNEDAFKAIKLGLLFGTLNIGKYFYKIHSAFINDLITEEKLVDFYFNTLLTQNPVPEIKTELFPIFGPLNAFNALSFEEYSTADVHYFDYLNGNLESLDKLISILYRKGHNRNFAEYGDKRNKFNIHATDLHLAAISKMDNTEKFMILMWWEHCRKDLMEMFPKPFENKGESSEVGTWYDTALNLSDGLVNLDIIKTTPVYLVFTEMTRLINNAEKSEA